MNVNFQPPFGLPDSESHSARMQYNPVGRSSVWVFPKRITSNVKHLHSLQTSWYWIIPPPSHLIKVLLCKTGTIYTHSVYLKLQETHYLSFTQWEHGNAIAQTEHGTYVYGRPLPYLKHCTSCYLLLYTCMIKLGWQNLVNTQLCCALDGMHMLRQILQYTPQTQRV